MATVIVWDRQNYPIFKHVVEDMNHTPFFKDSIDDLDPKEHYTFVLDTVSAKELEGEGYKISDLRDYKHPEQTTYVFGENTSKEPIWVKIRDKKLKGDIVYLQLPTYRILHSETSCAMVLYDRYVKQPSPSYSDQSDD